MKTRYLAKNLEVSAIGYGAMGLSEFYGAADDAQSLRVLHKLIELDQTFIDTADQYGRLPEAAWRRAHRPLLSSARQLGDAG